jgi:hypothetical protein
MSDILFGVFVCCDLQQHELFPSYKFVGGFDGVKFVGVRATSS